MKTLIVLCLLAFVNCGGYSSQLEFNDPAHYEQIEQSVDYQIQTKPEIWSTLQPTSKTLTLLPDLAIWYDQNSEILQSQDSHLVVQSGRQTKHAFLYFDLPEINKDELRRAYLYFQCGTVLPNKQIELLLITSTGIRSILCTEGYTHGYSLLEYFKNSDSSNKGIFKIQIQDDRQENLILIKSISTTQPPHIKLQY